MAPLISAYHAKYFAFELTKRCASDSVQKLAASLADAQVDLNPHQVEAAIFAFRSPLSKGAILADEVGLGKTIEAGILLSQKWAERKRRMLVIVPSSLRKQWSQELADKFFLPSVILEARSFNEQIKDGNLNPFTQDKIVICSYHFARNKDSYIKQTKWDLVIVDEAHRLRNVYKPTNKIANAIKKAIAPFPKVLLTATPLQNSLLELYGLVSIIDDYSFGDLKSFKNQFTRLTEEGNFDELKKRLKPICNRTLRRQVLEYIKFTNRICLTQEFVPSADEQKLYDLVSDYLQKPNLYALPPSQRQLMTLILRKLLASSTFAISGTLDALAGKLGSFAKEPEAESLDISQVADQYEVLDELEDEWDEEDEQVKDQTKQYSQEELRLIREEIKSLKEFASLAKSILKNSKGEVLLSALKRGFAEAGRKGGGKRAIIFTESTRTQDYLMRVLESTEYSGKIVLFNGSNGDPKSKQIYKDWMSKHQGTDRITGSPTADMRAALVDHFRDEAVIMVATEAAAEGINLQFCSLVVNYDLPWNPQRVEQRIGRCHRYGQKYDVVVVNFLNKNNAADQRVYQLLKDKFKLFDGVFGASDEVLGTIESGVDFEKRINQIYQNCRTVDQIQLEFDQLQTELGGQISTEFENTRKKLLENFDEEVHEKLRLNEKESKDYLGKYESWLWQLTQHYLEPYAKFEERPNSFVLLKNPFPEEKIHPGPYRLGKQIDDVNIYRIGHPLAQRIVSRCKEKHLEPKELRFHLSEAGKIISILQPLKGRSGWLTAVNVTLASFEAEDFVLLSANCDDGTLLDTEQCQRLFSLSAEEKPLVAPEDQEKYRGSLVSIIENQKKHITQEIENKNSKYYEIELDKLDAWADDRRHSLRVSIKEMEDQIKDLKKRARLAANIPDKLKLQKERAQTEGKRDQAIKAYETASKEIETLSDKLIDETEQRMKLKMFDQPLFTIRWSLV